ncbi:MAG TPA: hypothetical protein VG713_02285, partial [Pirellulales bacterium]|nr:hypothetical protein [Pirellulales bacterium]
MKSQLASQIAIGCVVLFAAGTLASAAPLSTKGLNAEDAKRLATALAAIKKDPKFSETSARYAEARKAYVADRAKFPAEREHDVAVRYHQATREFDAAQRQALLAFDATLAPLLAKAGALNRGRVLNEGETVADSDSAKNPAIAPITDVPGLPRVLLIGDSISIGYTLPVR